ncbi:MAG: hypothetical protein C7B46_10575 [Sulfobacillus benefaciens]|uniref:Uncharacterized protein n=1 Tax=Sulfobacillus benefaciens TaxID=453960 RepID=A0A2T2XFI9_9FIRM|nr:MAG: hypothetical protein C7B46_10575 [Sulfobacillus benefaciens]
MPDLIKLSTGSGGSARLAFDGCYIVRLARCKQRMAILFTARFPGVFSQTYCNSEYNATETHRRRWDIGTIPHQKHTPTQRPGAGDPPFRRTQRHGIQMKSLIVIILLIFETFFRR